MANYLSSFNSRKTAQSEPIPGSSQVRNDAGGFGWAVDDWTRLDRFLILGSEGGTYYVSERKLACDNAEAVLRCISTDGIRVVKRIVEISEEGRAPSNDPAIFCLALVFGFGDVQSKRAARTALSRVCRIGTHIQHFVAFAEQFRGWGKMLRGAVADWYNSKSYQDLIYHAMKYQERDGWSHRDLLALSHPKTDDEFRNAIYRWIAYGDVVLNNGIDPRPSAEIDRIHAAEQIKSADVKTAADLIRTNKLPREVVPTPLLNEPIIWEALLEDMPMGALLRNLATLTRVGLLAPLSDHTRYVVNQLSDDRRIRTARLHPMNILIGARTYEAGRGIRGKNTWDPVGQIVDALSEAFYASFGNVDPTGKRLLLALDVSGSMNNPIGGHASLSCREAAAAMALVTANVEENYGIVGFTAGHSGRWRDSGISPLAISPKQRLGDVVSYTRQLKFGGTDCALPMLWALENKISVDAFVVYTDSETWAGDIHPVQALRSYRDKMGIKAKLVVVAMTAEEFTIADPNDAGMLDVVGFDTAVPQVMSDFIAV